jgi:hypothetical protein
LQAHEDPTPHILALDSGFDGVTNGVFCHAILLWKSGKIMLLRIDGIMR